MKLCSIAFTYIHTLRYTHTRDIDLFEFRCKGNKNWTSSFSFAVAHRQILLNKMQNPNISSNSVFSGFFVLFHFILLGWFQQIQMLTSIICICMYIIIDIYTYIFLLFSSFFTVGLFCLNRAYYHTPIYNETRDIYIAQHSSNSK